jgi:hypothetical protein
MANPVSSIAYAIEAALRALDGDLASLVATMGVIVVVSLTYHQLIQRFPGGGGGSQGNRPRGSSQVGFLMPSSDDLSGQARREVRSIWASRRLASRKDLPSILPSLRD